MEQGIVCKNNLCKYYIHSEKCGTHVTITEDGRCGSFEKGLLYYFDIVFEALKTKNFIDMIEIGQNDDLRLGLYYVMDCYNLGFSEMEWGNCRFIMLKDRENGEGLQYKDIIDKEIDKEKLEKHLIDFQNGVLPCDSSHGEVKLKGKEFGWLSPTGEFTEVSFGNHEEAAGRICEEKGFKGEYLEWIKKNTESKLCLKRDFLSIVKGYCLIHNPFGYGGYMVSNMKELTKKQREFLYQYFMGIGDRWKAEEFIEE